MEKEVTTSKTKRFIKDFFKGFLLVFKCIGYLLYWVLFLWLIFDIINLAKKK